MTMIATTLAIAMVMLAGGVLGAFGGGFRAAAAPLGEYATRLAFTIAAIDPVVTTASSGNLVTVSGRFSNTGPDPIDDLSYRFQRGERLTTVGAVTAEVANPIQPVTVINPTFKPLPGRVDAGQSAGFAVSVPVSGHDPDSLGITEPGVYPVMINVNGTVHAAAGDTRARVGEVHLLVTVTGLPGGKPPTPGSATAAPIGILWPLADTPHLGLDGVFRDDKLTAEIEPGGRLADAVDALIDSGVNPNLVTLVVDPMLLDELDRMSHGYWVVAHPGSPQPALKPILPTTSTGPGAAKTTAKSSTSTSHTQASRTATSGAKATSAVPSAGESGAGSAGSAGFGGQSQQAEMTPSPGEVRSGSDAAAGAGQAARNGEAAGGSGASAQGSWPGAEQSPTQGVAAPGGASGAAAGQSQGATGASGGASATTTPATAATTPTQSPEPSAPPLPQPPDTVAGKGQAAAAEFLDELRGLARTHHVVVLPYGDPDVVALVRAGMSEAVATAVFRGRAVASRVLQQGLDTPGDATNLVADVAVPPGGALTDDAWAVLRNLGYRSAILGPTAVAATGASSSTPAATAAPPSGFVTIAVDGDEVPAVLTGGGHAPELAQVLDGGTPTDWADTVDRLAAVMTIEGAAKIGPMLVSPPRTFAPHSAGFAALAALLDNLSGLGMVLPTPATALARGVEPSGPGAPGPPRHVAAPTPVTLDYTAKAQAAELAPGYLTGLAELNHRLAVLGETLGQATGGPNPADILTPLSDTLLGAVSASWRGVSAPDQVVLHSVDATVSSLYAGVTITRDTGSYTLASASAPLLLTVHNSLPYQVTMTVRVVGGEQSGLITQDPGRIVIGPGPRSAPVRIQSSVSRSGTFTVYAQLQGTDGSRWGRPVPLTIDSRAYGALTVVLMVVAGGVLLLMVIWRLAQRSRGRGPAEGRRRRPSDRLTGGAVGAVGADGADGADGAGAEEPSGPEDRAMPGRDAMPDGVAGDDAVDDDAVRDDAGNAEADGADPPRGPAARGAANIVIPDPAGHAADSIADGVPGTTGGGART